MTMYNYARVFKSFTDKDIGYIAIQLYRMIGIGLVIFFLGRGAALALELATRLICSLARIILLPFGMAGAQRRRTRFEHPIDHDASPRTHAMPSNIHHARTPGRLVDFIFEVGPRRDINIAFHALKRAPTAQFLFAHSWTYVRCSDPVFGPGRKALLEQWLWEGSENIVMGASFNLPEEGDALNSLNDLPSSVAFYIYKTMELLPMDEWAPLLYTSRPMNDALCLPYLLRMGIVAGSVGDRSVSADTHVSRSETFLALQHWRHSRLFKTLDSATFTLSPSNAKRNSQMRALEAFFHSLPPGAPHITTIRLFLSDIITSTDLTMLRRVLPVASIGKIGCTNFIIHFSDDYSVDVDFGLMAVDGDGDMLVTLHLKVLDIESSAMFSKEILPWTLRTLRSSGSLDTLNLSWTGVRKFQWADILPLITLSGLRKLFIEGVGMHTLAHLLTRHGIIEEIDLEGLVRDSRPTTPTFALPFLCNVAGEGRSMASFLSLLTTEVSEDISFQGDLFEEDSGLQTFDAVAHFVAATRRLSLSFPCTVEQITTFFTTDVETRRPEQDLAVELLDLHFELDKHRDYAPIVAACRKWLSTFRALESESVDVHLRGLANVTAEVEASLRDELRVARSDATFRYDTLCFHF
ncbi:hypothetical protein SCHPADRAFT_933886 [Schizopora paradoxa]|uniref:Uncharacterized protein n=1 Tax=Schizopora paradoxa TaxID=27342 RepID=A0A0H2R0R3_9AGAM|nr:hypothetical protein SCHPADRAFT_933886 [Schizopora paradoxa]